MVILDRYRLDEGYEGLMVSVRGPSVKPICRRLVLGIGRGKRDFHIQLYHNPIKEDGYGRPRLDRIPNDIEKYEWKTIPVFFFI